MKLPLMVGSKAERGPSTLPIQAGALPWRREKKTGEPEVLLITSRSSGRWLIPKGSPMRGKTLWEAASIEALEEAGVEGVVARQAFGTFEHRKTAILLMQRVYMVIVFPLHVTEVHEEWQEMSERSRQWFNAAEAAQRVENGQFRELMQAFAHASGGDL
jgi:8-oxo-dGTP pyrophosphatase MutT (NUDIX family)